MNKIWLIGLGKMSYEYAKVLSSLKLNFDTIARSKNKISKKYHKNIYYNGLRDFLKKQNKPAEYAIIAVSVEELFNVSKILIQFGVKNILLEKPGSLTIKNLNLLLSKSKNYKTSIYIAYNRRYYQSIEQIKSLYLKNNNILSVDFNFTEIKNRFLNKFPDEVLDNWLIVNSSHVLDLVFYLIGIPKKINCFTYVPNYYKKKPSIFIGNGLSKKNIPFSYHSNWSSPGNWSISIMTNEYRIVLNPIEEIKIQKIGKFKIEDVNINKSIDKKFKPGLYNMVDDFIFKTKKSKLPTLKEHIINFKYFKKIANG